MRWAARRLVNPRLGLTGSDSTVIASQSVLV
jgi:hypothetical protein